MKLRMGRWILGWIMVFVFASVYAPPQAAAETHVVVSVGHTHHRHYYRRPAGHYVVYYRHGRRYRVYRHY